MASPRRSFPALALCCCTGVHGGRSFGTSYKGTLLPCQHERSVFSRDCAPSEWPCTMQHWWSGGTFARYYYTRIRYYCDNATYPVNVPLGLGHGMAAAQVDDNAPWSAGALFGRSGSGLHAGGPTSGSGLFNTFQVPFYRRINVTVSLGCTAQSHERFWLILRGRTRARIVIPGGMELPTAARLLSVEHSLTRLVPYASVPFLKVDRSSTAFTGGAVLFVTLTVRSPRHSFEFLEGCVRGGSGDDNSADNTHDWLLSSGTEDYFLGTFYFDRGQYFTPLAGVTSLCPAPKDGARRPASFGCTSSTDGSVSFSAYRVHAGHDPLTFEAEGLELKWRNGEPGHGGAATEVNASTFGLVYVW